MIKKPPVGAHYGLRDWLVQRVSAVLILLGLLVLFVAFFLGYPYSFVEWQSFILSGWVRIMLLVVILAAAWHGYIGVRDIFMDYIKHDGFRLFKIIGAAVYVIVCAIWAAHILL